MSDFSKIILIQQNADTKVVAEGQEIALLLGVQNNSLNANSFSFIERG